MQDHPFWGSQGQYGIWYWACVQKSVTEHAYRPSGTEHVYRTFPYQQKGGGLTVMAAATCWYWACVQNFSLSTKRGRAHSDGCSKSSTQKYSASKLLKSMSWKVWEDVLNQKGQMALWVPLSWGCMAEIGVLTLVLHCWTLVCWNCCHTAKIGVALLKLVCCNWCCTGEIGVL